MGVCGVPSFAQQKHNSVLADGIGNLSLIMVALESGASIALWLVVMVRCAAVVMVTKVDLCDLRPARDWQ